MAEQPVTATKAPITEAILRQSAQDERVITEHLLEEPAYIAPLPMPQATETHAAIVQAEQARHLEAQQEAVPAAAPLAEVDGEQQETNISREQTIPASQPITELRAAVNNEGGTPLEHQNPTNPQVMPEELYVGEAVLPITAYEERGAVVDPGLDASVAEIGTSHSESAPTIEPEQVEQTMRELLFESPADQQNYFIEALEVAFETADDSANRNETGDEAPFTILLEALQREQTPETHESEDNPTAVTIQKIIGTIHGHVAIREYATTPEIEAVEEQMQELVLELCSHLSIEITDEQVDSLVELLLSDKFALAISNAYASNHADIIIPTFETTEQGTHEAKIKFGNLARHTTHSIQSGMHQLLGSLAVISFQRV